MFVVTRGRTYYIDGEVKRKKRSSRSLLAAAGRPPSALPFSRKERTVTSAGGHPLSMRRVSNYYRDATQLILGGCRL